MTMKKLLLVLLCLLLLLPVAAYAQIPRIPSIPRIPQIPQRIQRTPQKEQTPPTPQTETTTDPKKALEESLREMDKQIAQMKAARMDAKIIAQMEDAKKQMQETLKQMDGNTPTPPVQQPPAPKPVTQPPAPKPVRPPALKPGTLPPVVESPVPVPTRRIVKDDTDWATFDWKKFGTVPPNASAEEKIAYSYIEAVVSMCEKGQEFTKARLTTAAELPYGTAAASICAMRYAVDCLLKIKGIDAPKDDRLCDWDEIASLGWASPYPYLFEGIVTEAGGNKADAMSLYKKAASNSAISEGDAYLGYIMNMPAEKLQTLRTVLTEMEDKIYAASNPMPAAIPRHERNFDPKYLREQAVKTLNIPAPDEQAETETGSPDTALAMQYYRAAISLEPFNGNNYAALAVLCIEQGDAQSAIGWLNGGLFIDPENKALNSLLQAMKGTLEP